MGRTTRDITAEPTAQGLAINRNRALAALLAEVQADPERWAFDPQCAEAFGRYVSGERQGLLDLMHLVRIAESPRGKEILTLIARHDPTLAATLGGEAP